MFIEYLPCAPSLSLRSILHALTWTLFVNANTCQSPCTPIFLVADSIKMADPKTKLEIHCGRGENPVRSSPVQSGFSLQLNGVGTIPKKIAQLLNHPPCHPVSYQVSRKDAHHGMVFVGSLFQRAVHRMSRHHRIWGLPLFAASEEEKH